VRRAASLVLVAALSAWTTGAGATTVGVVKVQHPPAVTGEVLIRLLGELRSLGLEPRMLEVPDPGPAGSVGPSPVYLRPLADEHGVNAVIALPGVSGPSAVEVYAADGRGRSVARRVSIDPGVGHAPQTVAIRAIELLRSCLLEIDLLAVAPAQVAKTNAPAPSAPPTSASPPPPSSTPTSPPSASTPPPSSASTSPPSSPSSSPSSLSPRADVSAGVDDTQSSRFGVAAGAIVVFTTDGVGPAVLPCLHLDWRLTAAWLVQADLAGAGGRGAVDGPTGSARVGQDQLLLGIGYRALPGRRVRPVFSVSVGALRTAVEGQALPPNLSHDVTRWSFLVDGGAGAVLRLADRWDLIAAGHVQAAAPYPAVRFVGQTVATAAAPNLLLGLTVEAWL